MRVLVPGLELVSFLLTISPSDFPPPLCPGYFCSPTSSLCSTSQPDDSVYIRPCPVHTYCDLNTHQCESFHTKYAPKTAYPGEICGLNIQCKDSICDLGRCRGKTEGESCERHTECEPGLYCGFVCRKLLQIGEIGCRNDYDCVGNAGCNSGICAEYYSLDTDSKIDTCESYQNRLCETGLCRDGRCMEDLHTVSATFPVPCDTSEDCEAVDAHGDSYYSECQCGLNPTGQKYCAVLPSDEVGSDYVGMLRLWTQGEEIARCNTQRRWSLHCMASVWKSCRVLEFLYKQYRYRDFPLLIDTLDCIQTSITRDYWEIRESFRQVADHSSDCDFAHKYGSFLLEDDLLSS